MTSEGSRTVSRRRVSDGIRTRDIQIHNLQTANLNVHKYNDLGQPGQPAAHLLPTDNHQSKPLRPTPTDPELAALLDA